MGGCHFAILFRRPASWPCPPRCTRERGLAFAAAHGRSGGVAEAHVSGQGGAHVVAGMTAASFPGHPWSSPPTFVRAVERSTVALPPLRPLLVTPSRPGPPTHCGLPGMALQRGGLFGSLSAPPGGGGGGAQLSSQLWHACAGPLVALPAVGSRVVYFPQGHIEQVAASVPQEMAPPPPYASLPPHLLCRLLSTSFHADPESDQVYAQMVLLPLDQQQQEAEAAPAGNGEESEARRAPVMFCKMLTASDTSTHGGFSIPRRAAETCLPPLDYSQQPPAQTLVAQDLHGNEWSFRHIYRGFPKRHLLTTGWSAYVSSRRLTAGDSVLFIRDERGQLRVGSRRALCQQQQQQQQQQPPAGAASSRLPLPFGALASAAHAAATCTPFTVFYNPRACSAPFVIPYEAFLAAGSGPACSAGTRFKMAYETDEATSRRFRGSIVSIGDADPARWPHSLWRSLKVGWDESIAGERPERVSPWEIEPISLVASLPATTRFRPVQAGPAETSPGNVPRSASSPDDEREVCEGGERRSKRRRRSAEGSPPSSLLSAGQRGSLSPSPSPSPSLEAAPPGPPPQSLAFSQWFAVMANAHSSYQPNMANLTMGPSGEVQQQPQQAVRFAWQTTPQPNEPACASSSSLEGSSAHPNYLRLSSTGSSISSLHHPEPSTSMQSNGPFGAATAGVRFQRKSIGRSTTVMEDEKLREAVPTSEMQMGLRHAVGQGAFIAGLPLAHSRQMAAAGSFENSEIHRSELEGEPVNRVSFLSPLHLSPPTDALRAPSSDAGQKKAASDTSPTRADVPSFLPRDASASTSTNSQDPTRLFGFEIFPSPSTTFAGASGRSVLPLQPDPPGEPPRSPASAWTAARPKGRARSASAGSQELLPLGRATRSRTKVYMAGSVGRTIDLIACGSYNNLRQEVGALFGLTAEDLRTGHQIVYTDLDGDVLLVGDDPWSEFVACVRTLRVLSPRDGESAERGAWPGDDRGSSASGSEEGGGAPLEHFSSTPLPEHGMPLKEK